MSEALRAAFRGWYPHYLMLLRTYDGPQVFVFISVVTFLVYVLMRPSSGGR